MENNNSSVVNESGSSMHLYAVAAVALVIGLVIGLGIGRNTAPTSNGSKVTVSVSPAKSNMTTANGDNTLVVKDQPAGKMVVVDSINLNQSAWIAIHEDKNGKLGVIYGARLFNSESKGGEVILLRATQPGMKYYAMLHNENGDRVFDFKQDLPLNDETGDPIMTSFMTTR